MGRNWNELVKVSARHLEFGSHGLQNRVLLGAAAASSVYIDVSWAEIETYE